METLIALDADTGKELWASPLSVAKFDGGGGAGTDNNNGGDGASLLADGGSIITFAVVLNSTGIDEQGLWRPFWQSLGDALAMPQLRLPHVVTAGLDADGHVGFGIVAELQAQTEAEIEGNELEVEVEATE